MRVHFASGYHPFPPPWLNVDFHDCGDQQVNLLEEFPDNLSGITWAYVGHFLEHLTVAEGVVFLRRVRASMATDGALIVVGPDVGKGRAWFEQGRIGDDLLFAMGRHGDPDGDDRADCHLWDCTGARVVEMLADAGWAHVEEFPLGELPQRFPEVPVIDLAEWQFAVVAR